MIYCKQLLVDVLQNKFLNKFCNIHETTPVLESLIKKRILHRCLPVNIVKLLRIPFPIEHLWWLLLYYLIAARIVTDLASQYFFNLT